MPQSGKLSSTLGINQAKLLALGTDTLIAIAASVTPGVNDRSFYTIEFGPALVPSAKYRMSLLEDGVEVAVEDVVEMTPTGWHVVASGATTEQLNRIEAKTNLIGTGSVNVLAMVAPTGEIASPIIIGDDYLEANGRAFSWTVPAVPGMTVEAVQFYFGGKPLTGGPGWLVLGEASDAGSGNWRVSAELPRLATQSLAEGLFRWSGEIRDQDGNEVTRIRSDSNRHVQLVAKQT